MFHNNFAKVVVNEPLTRDAFNAFTLLLQECLSDIPIREYHEEFEEHGFVAFGSEKGCAGFTYWINLDLCKSENVFPIAEELGSDGIPVEVMLVLLSAVLGNQVNIETTAGGTFLEAVKIVDEAFERTGLSRSPTAPSWSITPYMNRKVFDRPEEPEFLLF
jgi:hypothetical protein